MRSPILFLLTGFFFSVFAQQAPPRQIFFQSDNMIWWGAEFGLNRFQSENELWANIRPEAINDLALDETVLWVGTNHGVFYADLRYLDWKGYTASQGLPSDTIVRITADPDYIYTAGPHGLSRFNKLTEQWEPIGDFSGKRIYDLYSNQTQLWVATDSGVYLFDKKFEKWEHYKAGSDLISGTVFRLFYFNDNIWALTDKGFSRYSASMKTWNSYPLGGIVGSAVRYLMVDASYIWVSSPEGVSRFGAKNQTWENFSRNTPIEKLTTLGISTSGMTSWFATSNGVYSFDEQQRRWKTYTSIDGLSDDVQEEIYTNGQTTICRKGNVFSYLRPAEDLWYTSTIKVSGNGKGNGEKPKWKSHMDETGLGFGAPDGQSINLLGRAYVKTINKAEFPDPVGKSISDYILNKNLDSIVYTTDTVKGVVTKRAVDTVARFKDYLNGWTKAQLNVNADLNQGRTFQGNYDNTDPLGDFRYGAEYRGFGEDKLRRLGFKSDQKTDYFWSSLIAPTYLTGAGLRTEFGDRVGDKKLRRVNTGLWAGWRKTEFLRKLLQYREDNFYELGVQNIITESVEVTIDGQTIDPNEYSLERTMGLLTFKNEGIANPDSRIEISCQYQPVIGEYTSEVASAENVVALNNNFAIGANGAYQGIKEPDRTGLRPDTNRTFAGSVNGKIEMKSDDGKYFLRAIPEISSSYNDSILYIKQGSAGKLNLYYMANNLKFKSNVMMQTPNYVSLTDQNSIYGRLNYKADGELVYDLWRQYMPITVGSAFIDAKAGKEEREYAQYLISMPNLPSLKLYGMRQNMKNWRTTDLGDSLATQRWNGLVETEWDLPENVRSALHIDRLWFNVSYALNLLSDSLYDTTDTKWQSQQRLHHNIFSWIRFSPLKKIQLEYKNTLRFFQNQDNPGGPFSDGGNGNRSEIQLFSQEFIPGVTLYGNNLYDATDSIQGSDSIITSKEDRLNSSILLIPGVYWSLMNPFQLNIGYNISTIRSTVKAGVGSDVETEETQQNGIDQSFSIKPMLDFTQDLHFASRVEMSNSSNLSLKTGQSLKVYNEARTAFRDRKTRLDLDFNIVKENLYSPDYVYAFDTLTTQNTSYEAIFKWTERWEPNFRTEFPIEISWKDDDTSRTETVSSQPATISTGYLNTIAPGILFDWRLERKVIREFRVQYYIGMSFLNGHAFNFATYDLSQDNKVDIMAKVGSNFFFRLLLNVSYLFDEKVLKYDLAELKATALF